MPDFSPVLQLPQSFFGLTYEYTKYVSDEVYVLVKHGGFSYADCMAMPVHQRKIFLDTLFEEAELMRQKEEAAMNSHQH